MCNHVLKFSDVSNWKEEYEEKHGTYFVKSTGSKKVATKQIEYYYCNRTGFFTSVGQGQRHLKREHLN